MHTLEIKPLQFASSANIFFQSIGGLFFLFMVSFAGSSDGKESACNAGDLGSIPRWGRSLGGGKDYPLQYSCLENFMDREEPGRLEPMGSQRVGHD